MAQRGKDEGGRTKDEIMFKGDNMDLFLFKISHYLSRSGVCTEQGECVASESVRNDRLTWSV
jgi:hypothetical protein